MWLVRFVGCKKSRLSIKTVKNIMPQREDIEEKSVTLQSKTN